jgi:hypothetical protein
MDGLLTMAGTQRLSNNLDPVVAAACIAFGFVFIHPFMDGNGRIHRYPDLTRQAEFLYFALERTVTEDLRHEIDFLLGFDRAKHALNAMLDWPDHSEDLFIRRVHDAFSVLTTARGHYQG